MSSPCNGTSVIWVAFGTRCRTLGLPAALLFTVGLGLAAACAPASCDSQSLGGGAGTEAGPGEARGDSAGPSGTDQEPLLIYFLDVGQGEAVLIRSPSGQNVLYDGGDRGVELLGTVRALGVERLDLVIASHNHADHIGGLPPVIRAMAPGFVIENGLPHTTRAYEEVLLAIEASGSPLLEPERRTIRLGEAELRVIPPPLRPEWGQNNNSVGVRVRYGEFHATMFGDAEQRQFGWLLRNHRDQLLPVQVHKASHHGSRNGDVAEALRALRPTVVVMGLGQGNMYGYPHPEALVRYRAIEAETYRTDLHGTVRIEALPSGAFHVTTERGGRRSEIATYSCVDVNSASREELTRIFHIDAARAEQIVKLRGQRRFRELADLTRVRGVGPARANDITAQGLACVL